MEGECIPTCPKGNGYFETYHKLFQMAIPEAYANFTVKPLTDPDFYDLPVVERIRVVNTNLEEKRHLLNEHREEEPPINCVFHWGWQDMETKLETEISQLMDAMFLLWRERMGELKEK